ncbi:MAG: lytic transglycosylase domain-containing protein, partial [Alphaproteobacteria bacterium]
VLDQAGAAGRRPFPAAGRIEAIARRFGPAIAAAARRHRLSEALLIAVIAVESGGRADALSPRDARGLMQLIPATARRMGVRDVWNPTQNILGGARYLDHLLEMFGGDLILALAGYNAGENAVLRHGGVPAFPETRGYVPRVLDAFLQAQRLCPQAAPDPRAPCPIAGAIRPTPAPALPPPLGPRRPG